MFTTVIIGNSETYLINGKLVTPRGYKQTKTEMQHDDELNLKTEMQQQVELKSKTEMQQQVELKSKTEMQQQVELKSRMEPQIRMIPASPRFPLFIPVEGNAVLIVGGGKVAARRAKTLLDFGAKITVTSPEINDDMQKIIKKVVWEKKPYDGIDQNYSLVIATTNDRDVNKRIGEDAKSLGIPVSVADRKEESTFWFPAIARGSGIVAGLVSEEGNHTAVKNAAINIRDLLTGNVK